MVAVTASLASYSPPTPPSEPSVNASDMPSNSAKLSSVAVTPARQPARHIWVITGPAGCGKTSVAESLQNVFSLPYLEGDTFHTPENVEKMANGHPLTDADRWDWLIVLREQALNALVSNPSSSGVIVTCSALKRKYRDVMRIASYYHPNVQVHFIFLNATEALLIDRVRARKGHYMKDSMVRSQFQSLETPQSDEVDIISVDASGTSTEVQNLSVDIVRKMMSL
ncbi:Hypothetical protein R9X50_00246600 [Acrodontium crateriforme]|uniref:Gluconokinase n=1 Tax=Acrodontium crateriforme TaxID=150365 RepID=A0AAQ3M3X1_9PEZI|nr:Hypothetical protein R9X50_00246600 [Acrodontium crateriforme]